eukprot:3388087-Rhodomonas_salina.1
MSVPYITYTIAGSSISYIGTGHGFSGMAAEGSSVLLRQQHSVYWTSPRGQGSAKSNTRKLQREYESFCDVGLLSLISARRSSTSSEE